MKGEDTTTPPKGGPDPSQAPAQPGCYLMKDGAGKIIYVGKAKNLRARVRSYFNLTDGRPTVKFLMGRVAAVDYLVVGTEKEALLLENSLIKQHRPKYNVRLKDDKTYLSLRIDPREEFPRLTVVRRTRQDGARYFGPYHDAQAARKTLRQIQRLFPLRTCSDAVLRNRTRPCLYHQMGQCLAPCVGLAGREAYHAVVSEVLLVLEGRSGELERRLLENIRTLAEGLRFEEAAALRDRLRDLGSTFERQRSVVGGPVEDRDVFGAFTEGRYTEVQALFYRGGRLLGGKSHSFEAHDLPLGEVLGSFLLQFYDTAAVIPREVLLPVEIEDAGALGEVLAEKRGGRVDVLCPQRGEKAKLVELAAGNAKRAFAEKRLAEKAAGDTLELVRDALRLPRIPQRIECFDISTMQGDKTVASMAVFEGGRPAKQRYRRYIIGTVAGQDDFASLREALTRRYTRAIAEDDLPDLVLIDGGRGQLGVATAVLKDLGLDDLPHAGIAKSRLEEGGKMDGMDGMDDMDGEEHPPKSPFKGGLNSAGTEAEGERSPNFPVKGGLKSAVRTPERFFLPNRVNPVVPPQNGPVVRMLAALRDEAHRFAITLHRKRRGKATLTSALLGIPGVGPKRAKALLAAVGSVARLRAATAAEIAAVPGFSMKLARVVLGHLQTDGADAGEQPPAPLDGE